VIHLARLSIRANVGKLLPECTLLLARQTVQRHNHGVTCRNEQDACPQGRAASGAEERMKTTEHHASRVTLVAGTDTHGYTTQGRGRGFSCGA